MLLHTTSTSICSTACEVILAIGLVTLDCRVQYRPGYARYEDRVSFVVAAVHVLLQSWIGDSSSMAEAQLVCGKGMLYTKTTPYSSEKPTRWIKRRLLAETTASASA